VALNAEPLPVKDRVVNIRRKDIKPDEVDPNEGKMTAIWQEALSAQGETVAQAASRIALVELTAQSATIGATPLLAEPSAGLYRLSWFAKISVADGVSSSLTISALFTDEGDSITISGSAITGNTVSTVQSGVLQLHSDAGVPISYSATRVSGGGGPAMQFSLYVTLESVAA
jgi:hypothetical protein